MCAHRSWAPDPVTPGPLGFRPPPNTSHCLVWQPGSLLCPLRSAFRLWCPCTHCGPHTPPAPSASPFCRVRRRRLAVGTGGPLGVSTKMRSTRGPCELEGWDSGGRQGQARAWTGGEDAVAGPQEREWKRAAALAVGAVPLLPSRMAGRGQPLLLWLPTHGMLAGTLLARGPWATPPLSGPWLPHLGNRGWPPPRAHIPESTGLLIPLPSVRVWWSRPESLAKVTFETAVLGG